MPPKLPENRLHPAWDGAGSDHVVGLAWSPNGRFLAVASVGGPIEVFDANSGTVAATLSGHAFGTMAIAWAPTGERLATAGQDGKIRIWDATLWQERAALDGGAAWVEKLAFSTDGKELASAAGKKVRVWNDAGELVREFADHGSTVSDLAWRGPLLSAASYGGVRLYNVATGETRLNFEWKGAPLAIAWSPNGAMLAHGNQDATIHFWYAAKPATPLQMSGYSTKVRELSWDATSRYLACGGSPAVCVWDCGGRGPEGSKPTLLKGHDEPISAVAWQRRGFRVASGCSQGRVNLWQPAKQKDRHVGAVSISSSVSTIAWSPNDKLLAVGGTDGAVRMISVH